ncbi:calcium/sodium antiporter [Marinobacter nanhaiticus D15-8W]|uniref:Calcium/sodium antiporter n=1 Tax=Marinobacter nanhaiticus D15-8W TaxID=626887 RepID=N6WP88_9GAMM|nr:calcium/sodium antiporter [Marinobacter nanhaiticus]ENO13371.1 calcium/sodium antiporter [Marinobacter nanhaiticus D15-8W]BES70738.1 calcium/sodium antiporter [Marinobacter nanhaiticus D15-8W]
MSLLPYIGALVAGLVLLIWSADRFVEGSVAIARGFGMSPLLIGLTIVAFGTSAPEMLVSATAALTDAPALAVGNALGSNIANIGLVLGITTLIAPIPLKRTVLFREFPILLAVTILVFPLLLDNELSPLDGILFLIMLGVSLFLMSRNNDPSDAPEFVEELEDIPAMTTGRAVLWFVIGLAALVLSSRILVWGATEMALSLGVSELIVGLTIVAIGTSLPELAASVASALKGHHDVALGNIVGSNLFNLLAVLAMPALLNPLRVETDVLYRDYATMGGLTLLLAAFAYGMQKKGKLARFEGGILLAGYIAYTALLYHAAR